MTEDLKFKYGLSTGLFVTRKPGGRSLVVGGIGEGDMRWTRVLSNRAAQLLWFHLVQFLYPDRSANIKAEVMTAPIRGANLPTVTDHMEVEATEDKKGFQIIGYTGSRPVWRASLAKNDAQQFWTALDAALYPNGIKHD